MFILVNNTKLLSNYVPFRLSPTSSAYKDAYGVKNGLQWSMHACKKGWKEREYGK
jgi:hypothetical protein